MGTRPKRPRDPIALAKLIGDIATGQATDEMPGKKATAGRAGGLKGGKTRMGGLTEQERIELAQKAAAARWGKAPPTVPGGGKKRPS